MINSEKAIEFSDYIVEAILKLNVRRYNERIQEQHYVTQRAILDYRPRKRNALDAVETSMAFNRSYYFR